VNVSKVVLGKIVIGILSRLRCDRVVRVTLVVGVRGLVHNNVAQAASTCLWRSYLHIYLWISILVGNTRYGFQTVEEVLQPSLDDVSALQEQRPVGSRMTSLEEPCPERVYALI